MVKARTRAAVGPSGEYGGPLPSWLLPLPEGSTREEEPPCQCSPGALALEAREAVGSPWTLRSSSPRPRALPMPLPPEQPVLWSCR